jgi:hypothetical protein
MEEKKMEEKKELTKVRWLLISPPRRYSLSAAGTRCWSLVRLLCLLP